MLDDGPGLPQNALRSIFDPFVVGTSEAEQFGLRLKPGVDKRALKAVRKIKSTTVENHRTGDVETKVEIELWDKMKAIAALKVGPMAVRFAGAVTLSRA